MLDLLGILAKILTMSEIKAGFSFPGMDRFTEEQAARLAELVQGISGCQPQAVISVCETEGVGYLPSGFPDTSGIARIEKQVKIIGCFCIALETARLLSGKLPSQEIIDLIEQNDWVYENIPQAIFDCLQRIPDSN